MTIQLLGKQFTRKINDTYHIRQQNCRRKILKNENINELYVNWVGTVQTSGILQETWTCTGTDHRSTSTRHRRRPPHVAQVRVAGSRHQLDRRRQKDGVSNPKQGRWRPEAHSQEEISPFLPLRRRHSNGPCRRRSRQRQRCGHSRQVRPSDNSVRQLLWLLSFTTIELVSQLGYSRSSFSTVHNSVTFIHWSQLYFVSVTIVHHLTKTVSRRTFTSPLTRVHLYCTTLSGHLMQVSHWPVHTRHVCTSTCTVHTASGGNQATPAVLGRVSIRVNDTAVQLHGIDCDWPLT